MHHFFFFAAPDNIQENTVTLTDEDFRHCIQVLRKNIGDEIDITDGRGKIITAVIETIDKNSCDCRIVQVAFQEKKDIPEILLTFGMLKSSALENLVRDTVALGVTELVPLLMKHSVKPKFNADRLHRIAIESVKQSGNCYCPIIRKPQKFSDWIVSLDRECVKLIADQAASRRISDIYWSTEIKKPVIVLIGPEGGFHPGEMNMAVENGFIPVNISPYRLRSELAAVVAVSALLNRGIDE